MKTFSINTRYICTDDGKNIYVSSSSQNCIKGLPEFSNEDYALNMLSILKEDIANGIRKIVNNDDGTYSIV